VIKLAKPNNKTYNIYHFLSENSTHSSKESFSELNFQRFKDVVANQVQKVGVDPKEADVARAGTLEDHQVFLHGKLLKGSNFSRPWLGTLPGQSESLSCQHFEQFSCFSSL